MLTRVRPGYTDSNEKNACWSKLPKVACGLNFFHEGHDHHLIEISMQLHFLLNVYGCIVLNAVPHLADPLCKISCLFNSKYLRITPYNETNCIYCTC